MGQARGAAVAKKAASKAKSSKRKAPAAASDRPPVGPLAGRPDERLIRERGYCIWIDEGRPHGRDLAHWQRARQELLREAL